MSCGRLPWIVLAVAIAGAATTAWSGGGHAGYRSANGEIEHELRVPNRNARSGSCGFERWSVKTGTDADAHRVDLAKPMPQTIAGLRALPAPKSLPHNARVRPAETTAYVLEATLVEYMMQSDSDYRLVIKDAGGNTLVAEIPDPACVATDSPFAQGIRHARTAFDAKYATTSRAKTANIPVRVTGVGFFDVRNGMAGVAPNAFELHPVIAIEFNPLGK